ncbi:MAG: NADH-quinone oxidoreductase subunit L [Planctomycetota bacterium]|nr:NADH-quinone oxidoreductase subunit L [Planctomycetota bacterium]
MLTLALLILIGPLVGFVLQSLFGKKLPRQGDWLTVIGIGVSLVCSIWILFSMWLGDATPFKASWDWFQMGAGDALSIGIYIDGLTAVMLFVVALVAFLVHVFSIGYMHGDPKYWQFFAWLQMFSFSMLVLVLANNLLHLFMGWELVGLCSYKLIGFWSEKPDPANAARKAFITTRIGDLGMMVAAFAIYAACGSFDFDKIFAAVESGNFDSFWLGMAGMGLFIAAVGKSAQMPLHVWLPDAMEGPTPVSALIHAATMVAAGVYLVGRMMPMLTPDVLTVIATVGATTGLMAGLIALAQDDIKKVLAYSTVSQLGYMFLGLGTGAWHAGLFHLTTHAFFKALMFLGSGSVIHACHHEQDMRKMGGLWKKLPVTGTTFFIGVLAIAGLPFLSGFYSKDAILAGAYGRFPHLFWIGLAAAVLTAFYMMRLFVMTFMGKPRDQHIYDHAHEGGISMTLPLIVLGFLAVVSGWPFLGWNTKLLDPSSMGQVLAMPTILSYEQEHASNIVAVVMPLAIAAGLIGLFLGWLVFGKGADRVPALKKPFRWMEVAFQNKFWFDELFRELILKPGYAAARFCTLIDSVGVDGAVNGVGKGGVKSGRGSAWTDNFIVDGLVRLTGAICQVGGSIVSTLQSGRVRMYLSLSVGVVAITLVLRWLL